MSSWVSYYEIHQFIRDVNTEEWKLHRHSSINFFLHSIEFLLAIYSRFAKIARIPMWMNLQLIIYFLRKNAGWTE